MTYEIVFNTDGTVSFPDLPNQLFPVIEALGGQVPSNSTNNLVAPKYLKSKKTILPFVQSELTNLPVDVLWKAHKLTTETTATINTGVSLLDLKIELARRTLMSCNMCELHCNIDRWNGEKGPCGNKKDSYYTRCFLNWSEEQHLTPSITISLSGCNWRCVYCQYPEFLASNRGEVINPLNLTKKIMTLWQQGGKNIHWVGGNPDQHLWPILLTLQQCESPIPVVWNSNGFASIVTLELLNGIVDTHLIDFRHWDERCASHYGLSSNSHSIIKRNIERVAKQKDVELIVRHLQLPEHFECCTSPILHWLAQKTPDIKLNLMRGQYRPEFIAHHFPEINRRLTVQERIDTENLALKLGLTLVE